RRSSEARLRDALKRIACAERGRGRMPTGKRTREGCSDESSALTRCVEAHRVRRARARQDADREAHQGWFAATNLRRLRDALKRIACVERGRGRMPTGKRTRDGLQRRIFGACAMR